MPTLDEMLANLRPSMQGMRGNLIVALDATASRQGTWDQATHLTSQMFKAVAATGALSMQVGYFRGDSTCAFSAWKDDPLTLMHTMQKIVCAGGLTQIRKVLEHAAKENAKQKVSAMIYIGDHVEEHGGDTRDMIAGLAHKLTMPVFVFQEGDEEFAGEVFKDIARITNGKYFKFAPESLPQLADVLATIAKFAVGGTKALSGPELKMLGRS